MVALLLSKGADKSIKDTQQLDALAWAKREEHQEVAELLDK
jgi:hypothetical protein